MDLLLYLTITNIFTYISEGTVPAECLFESRVNLITLTWIIFKLQPGSEMQSTKMEKEEG